MSWDIFVQDFPADARTVDDIPKDYRPGPIGQRSAIIQKIKEVVPDADFSDPTLGRIQGADYSIEVHIGHKEELTGFLFAVRGSDDAVEIITTILRHLGLRAVAGGEFYDPATAVENMRRWRAYRDQIFGLPHRDPSRSPDSDI